MRNKTLFRIARQRVCLLITAMIVCGMEGYAQSNLFGSWSIVNVDYSLNDKVSFFGEAQLRSQRFYNDFHYHEIKGGVSYKPGKSLGLLAGFGDYVTYSEGGSFKSPVQVRELRLWEQLTLVNNIGFAKIEHRYRLEQRWRNDEFRNRLRYRLNALVPLNGSKIENGTVFLAVFNELFLTNQGPVYFERNRFFVGAGYRFSKMFTLQMGGVRQTDYTTAGGTSKDFLQTTLFFRLHSADKGEVHPAAVD